MFCRHWLVAGELIGAWLLVSTVLSFVMDLTSPEFNVKMLYRCRVGKKFILDVDMFMLLCIFALLLIARSCGILSLFRCFSMFSLKMSSLLGLIPWPIMLRFGLLSYIILCRACVGDFLAIEPAKL